VAGALSLSFHHMNARKTINTNNTPGYQDVAKKIDQTREIGRRQKNILSMMRGVILRSQNSYERY
jgi:hypothetical protein